MPSKRIPDLTNFTPIGEDSIVVYDQSEDTTKRATISSLPSINNLILKALSANATGADSSSAQPWFPTNGGAVVQAATSYLFEGTLRISRAAGTTSHTTSLLFGGTATLSSIMYSAMVNTGDVVTNAAMNQTTIEVTTATVVKAASTSATEQVSIMVRGIVRVTNGGTLVPQFQYSAAPGGVPTILVNSRFSLYPIGSSTVATVGTWS